MTTRDSQDPPLSQEEQELQVHGMKATTKTSTPAIVRSMVWCEKKNGESLLCSAHHDSTNPDGMIAKQRILVWRIPSYGNASTTESHKLCIGDLCCEFTVEEEAPITLLLSCDNLLFAATEGSKVIVMELVSNEGNGVEINQKKVLDISYGRVLAGILIPGTDILCVASETDTISFFSISNEHEDCTPLFDLGGHSSFVSCLTLGCENELLFSGGYDGRVFCWSVADLLDHVSKLAMNVSIASNPKPLYAFGIGTSSVMAVEHIIALQTIKKFETGHICVQTMPFKGKKNLLAYRLPEFIFSNIKKKEITDKFVEKQESRTEDQGNDNETRIATASTENTLRTTETKDQGNDNAHGMSTAPIAVVPVTEEAHLSANPTSVWVPKEGDYVWFKYQHLPYWPCEILEIHHNEQNNRYNIELEFFGDGATATAKSLKKFKPFYNTEFEDLYSDGVAKQETSKDANKFSKALNECLKLLNKTKEEMIEISNNLKKKDAENLKKRKKIESSKPKKKRKYGPGTPYCYEDRSFNPADFQVARSLEEYFKEKQYGNSNIQPPLPKEPPPLHLLE
eukprot:m.82167 g.82167  ORF g.82167 m.82167 type:complete len:567 (+) comp12856_c0_seq5:3292-4992(+)